MGELLPCPFCGGEVRIEKTIDRREWFGVICRNTENVGCSCAVSIQPSVSREAAIGRWNKRAVDVTAIREVIAAINYTGMPGTEQWADKLSKAIGDKVA